MKTLKKASSVFLICLSLFITQSLFAQKKTEREGRRPSMEQRIEHMTTELELTEEQQSQLKLIFEKTKTEMQTIKESEDDVENKKAAFRSIMEQQEKEIEKILTEEQRTLAVALKKERHANRQERKNRAQRGKSSSAEERLKRMSTELELTEQQQSTIKEIFQNTQKDLKTLKENGDEGENKKTAFREIMERQEKMIGEVLTDEQNVKWLEVKKERRAKVEERKDKAQDKRDLFKEMKTALDAYRLENIVPVTQEQRKQLETQLSERDKRKLSEIRAKLRENKKEFEKFEYVNRYHMISAVGLRGSIEEEYMKLREVRKTEMDKARLIEKKYTAQIQALQNEYEPQAEQWKADMKAIKEKYIPKDHEARRRPNHAKKHMLKDENFDMDEHKRVRFLLQEPSGDKVNEVDGTVKVFPNPAQGQVTIEYTLTKSGKVSLELQNYIGRGGKLVFNNRYHEAGTYQEVVNLEGLTDTSYMVGLFTPDGHVVTTQLVIKK